MDLVSLETEHRDIPRTYIIPMKTQKPNAAVRIIRFRSVPPLSLESLARSTRQCLYVVYMIQTRKNKD